MPVFRTFHKGLAPIEDFEEICSTAIIHPSSNYNLNETDLEENLQEKEIEITQSKKRFLSFSWYKCFSLLHLGIKKK